MKKSAPADQKEPPVSRAFQDFLERIAPGDRGVVDAFKAASAPVDFSMPLPSDPFDYQLEARLRIWMRQMQIDAAARKNDKKRPPAP